MKMSPLSVVLWLSQLLPVYAIDQNLLTTHGLDNITRNPRQTTEATSTNQPRLKTATAATAQPRNKTTVPQRATTVSSPADEFLTAWTQPLPSTLEPSGTVLPVSETEAESSQNAVGTETVSSMISTSDHIVESLETASSNPARLPEENTETGTRSGVFTTGTQGATSHGKVHTGHAMDVNNWENGTSLQTDHTIQMTTGREERSEGTGTSTEESNTTAPLKMVPQHQHVPTPTYATTQIETSTHAGNQVGLVNQTTGYTSGVPSSEAGDEITTGYHQVTGTNTTPKEATVTQMTSSDSKNTSIQSMEQLTESTMSASTVSEVSPEVGTDQDTTESLSTTQRNMYRVDNTTWNTESLPKSSFTTGQHVHTTESYNTTGTVEDTCVGNQTTSTPDNSTVGSVHVVPTSHRDLDSQATTGHHITTLVTQVTQVTSSDGNNVSIQNTEGHLVSTMSSTTASATSAMVSTDWQQEPTENGTTTQISTGTKATHTPSDSIWKTSNITEERVRSNVSHKEVWLDCFDTASSSQGRQSKLVCLITLWSLGMTASIFLGTTIFLWVRLSILKKKAKRRRNGWRGKTYKSTAKERKSLWATDGGSAEERAEFWYANGSTLEADKKGKEPEKDERRKRKNGRQKEGNEEDMWIQPKVTMQDITEFWYANRRERNEDGMERQRRTTEL